MQKPVTGHETTERSAPGASRIAFDHDSPEVDGAEAEEVVVDEVEWADGGAGLDEHEASTTTSGASSSAKDGRAVTSGRVAEPSDRPSRTCCAATRCQGRSGSWSRSR